jgi:paraquat-inducible protein B
LFDITITVELQQIHAKDLSTTVERLTSVIGPKLARDRASFHVNVKPAADKLDQQPSLFFLERDAA